jgi:DNA modification methylase
MRNQIIQGDALSVLKTLPDSFVQCCITSPPYFGLRDYGVEGQIGHEETPDEYIANLVAVFWEVRRVLCDDGTLWVNIGDSYANDQKWGGHSSGKHQKALHTVNRPLRYTGLPGKNLIGIPWMLAFALRTDGYYLRSDIIWEKPDCLPESVTDRPTKSHEYLFLLAKSERYYYDAQAIREQGRKWTGQAGTFARNNGKSTLLTIPGQSRVSHREERNDRVPTGRNKRSVWTIPTASYKAAHFATFPPKLIEPCILAGSRPGDIVLDPFMGAGTVALVAIQHKRDYLGIELNPEYIELINKRIDTVQQGLWTEVA